MNEINERLLKAQGKWENECYDPLKEKYKKDEGREKLSCAFSFGVSEHYLDGKKKVMVIGQEANGHTFDYDTWGLKNWQTWAMRYAICYSTAKHYSTRKRRCQQFCAKK